MVGKAHSKQKKGKHKCIDTVASVANTRKDKIKKKNWGGREKRQQRLISSHLPVVVLMAKKPSGLPDISLYEIFWSTSTSSSVASSWIIFVPAGLFSSTDG